MSSTLPRLSVIGLGKLGSPMAAVFAHKGYEVIGLDINAGFVEALAGGRAPVDETGLQAMINQNKQRIRATLDWKEAVHESDITFIIVPTPSGPDKFFTNRYLVDALQKIGEALRSKNDYHLVVITSTTMPGSTGGELRQALEQASGRKVGPALGLCYNPEFIALGSVIRDMLRPDMILIGESDAKAGDMLESVYRNSTDTKPEFHRMNFVNAELTKISVNTFVTTKISYANMIADMCDRLPDADADVVNAAVGADSRIGRKYLKAAIGYGGPCFPRDNKAFAALGRKLGARCDLAEATDHVNDYQLARLQGAVEASASAGAGVAILGLSYKPETAVTEAAQGVMLANQLSAAGYAVTVFDPQAGTSARGSLKDQVKIASSMQEAVGSADVVVIATPWANFKELSGSDLSAGGRKRTVIDPWRALNAEAAAKAARHIILGKYSGVAV